MAVTVARSRRPTKRRAKMMAWQANERDPDGRIILRFEHEEPPPNPTYICVDTCESLQRWRHGAISLAWKLADAIERLTHERNVAREFLAAERAEYAKTEHERNAIAARFDRLAGICRRLKWTGVGDPAIADDGTKSALSDLAEWLFAEGIDEAILARAALKEPHHD